MMLGFMLVQDKDLSKRTGIEQEDLNFQGEMTLQLISFCWPSSGSMIMNILAPVSTIVDVERTRPLLEYFPQSKV